MSGRNVWYFNDLLTSLQDFVPLQNCSDKWNWKPTPDGLFTVSSISKRLNNQLACQQHFQTVWCNLFPRKVNIFIWRACNRLIPVREQLHQRGIDLSTSTCPICFGSPETVDHILLCHQTATEI